MRIFTFLTLFFNLMFALDQKCIEYTRYLNIDTEIRSNLGWRRVCRNHMLFLYIDKRDKEKEQYICQHCFNKIDTRIGSSLGGAE